MARIHGGTKAREINVEEPASSGWSSLMGYPDTSANSS
jgi:hypothetical protein